jgi:hypothetical protein
MSDLQSGLKSGVALNDMLVHLSDGRFNGKTIRAPKMKLQMISNLNMGLAFMKAEGIHLTNIGSVGAESISLSLSLSLSLSVSFSSLPLFSVL